MSSEFEKQWDKTYEKIQDEVTPATPGPPTVSLPGEGLPTWATLISVNQAAAALVTHASECDISRLMGEITQFVYSHQDLERQLIHRKKYDLVKELRLSADLLLEKEIPNILADKCGCKSKPPA